jgi:2-hydroxy-3-keto-5-methylthiopentenyl-1-phosphate phosphatase
MALHARELAGTAVQVFCDFDGTVTTQDTTDVVLRELALPDWEALEESWVAGRITAAECMRRQVALIQGDDTALAAVLERIELRAGFETFVRWCELRALPLVVVSDGVDHFIAHVLRRHGLDRLPVVANRLVGVAGARRLENPWGTSVCAGGSGVCKCLIARAQERGRIIYVGDGRSDFCVAEAADLLFARSTLAVRCRERGLEFVAYETFAEVQQYLAAMQTEQGAVAMSAAAD